MGADKFFLLSSLLIKYLYTTLETDDRATIFFLQVVASVDARCLQYVREAFVMIDQLAAQGESGEIHVHADLPACCVLYAHTASLRIRQRAKFLTICCWTDIMLVRLCMVRHITIGRENFTSMKFSRYSRETWIRENNIR